MGFVRGSIDIEDWLCKSELVFNNLGDSEYRELLDNWRVSFEEIIREKSYRYQGEKAMRAVQDELPCNVFIFNFPGYKFLPASTNSKDKAYGYLIKNLNDIDKRLLNSCDAIICDEEYRFTCMYTHEWESLALPRYYSG